MRLGIQKKIGWVIVSAVLIYSGVRNLVTGKIYGKVRISENPPSMEGWDVRLIGLALSILGVVLVYKILRK